jgi:hypothetical protein
MARSTGLKVKSPEPGRPEEPPARPPVRVVPPDAVFALGELQAVLGLPRHTLKREARLGRLRVAKRAGRLWCLGCWVREWLERGEVRRAPSAAAACGTDTAPSIKE